MDAFGIGNAIKGMVSNYFHLSRHTGRTTALLESLKNGDRVIVDSDAERRRLQNLIHEGFGLKDVEVLWVPVTSAHAHRLMEMGTSQGRTVFDHTWVENFYMDRIKLGEEHLQRVSEHLSGYGMKHVETKLAAKEAARWRF